METSKHLTREKEMLRWSGAAVGGERARRRAQEESDTASPSVSPQPTSTRSSFVTATVSPQPSNVTAGGQGPLEGVWLLQAGLPVQMYAEPGTSSIVAFYPPWSEGFSYTEESYYTFFDELLQVDVSATAVSGPVTLTVTPLLWVCSPVEAYRGSTDLEEACFWAGDGAPDEYFIIETLPAGSSKRWSLTPDNSTLYPTPLYYSGALWFRVSGPDPTTTAVPSSFSLLVEMTMLPSPSMAPSYIPPTPIGTPSAFPTAMAPTPGSPIVLRSGQSFQYLCQPYSITYMFLPLPDPPLATMRGINVSITADSNPAEVWVTPFAYTCFSGDYFNADWWSRNCSWAGDDFIIPADDPAAPMGLDAYWRWEVVYEGETTTIVVTPEDGYMYPDPQLGQTGLWIGSDSFAWGESAIMTIKAEWWAPGNPSPSASPSLGATATRSPVPPPSPTASPSVGSAAAGGGDGILGGNSALVIGGSVGGAAALLVAGLVAAFCCRRGRGATASGGGPSRKARMSPEALEERAGQLHHSVAVPRPASGPRGGKSGPPPAFTGARGAAAEPVLNPMAGRLATEESGAAPAGGAAQEWR